MNVVLSIDAIHPPLAGIGRYTWELATRLPLHPEVETIRFLSDGLWRELPKIELDNEPSADAVSAARPAEVKLNYKGRVRQFLGRLTPISRLYAQLVPLIASRQLNTVKNGIFHGTNFFVPKTKLPSLVTIHDLSIYRYPQWHPQARIERMRMTIPESVQRANLVLTDSQATKIEVMQEFNLSNEQVCAVPLGVDGIFHPRSELEIAPILAQYGLQPGGYSFFVSTIEPRKNLINLLAAYRLLPIALRSAWPLVLVGGGGWKSDDIHVEIERATREGWLKYLGFIDQRLLPVFYAGCRLFTYPSWYEGFGLPIAEAMASGVPVLTSNCSSMPEVAGGAAMLVEPGDVSSIYQGLTQALDDDNWRVQAIHRGLQRASELTWDACVQKTLQAYQLVQKSI